MSQSITIPPYPNPTPGPHPMQFISTWYNLRGSCLYDRDVSAPMMLVTASSWVSQLQPYPTPPGSTPPRFISIWYNLRGSCLYDRDFSAPMMLVTASTWVSQLQSHPTPTPPLGPTPCSLSVPGTTSEVVVYMTGMSLHQWCWLLHLHESVNYNPTLPPPHPWAQPQFISTWYNLRGSCLYDRDFSVPMMLVTATSWVSQLPTLPPPHPWVPPQSISTWYNLRGSCLYDRDFSVPMMLVTASSCVCQLQNIYSNK